MKNSILKTSVASLITLTLCFSLLSCGGSPDDAEIKASVEEALSENNDLTGITVDVTDGVVTLNGECLTTDCDSLAENQIKGVDGIKGIDNKITENTGTDLTLRTAVQSVISKYDGVQADVAAGVVVLRGTIEKNQVEPLMNELEMLKPKKLDNQLALK